jgi:hypothetical protein
MCLRTTIRAGAAVRPARPARKALYYIVLDKLNLSGIE